MPGAVELVGYYSLRTDAGALDREDDLRARCATGCRRTWCPPTSSSSPSSRCCPATRPTARACPPPTGPRAPEAAGEHVAPAGPDRDGRWPSCWPQLLGLDRVSVDSHFFDDLGANSLLLARFCARGCAEHRDLPPVVDARRVPAPDGRGARAALPATARRPDVAPGGAPAVDAAGDRARYLLCGAVQLLSVARAPSPAAPDVVVRGLDWSRRARGLRSTCGAVVVVAPAPFAGCLVLPVAAKWLLIGRWTAAGVPALEPALPAVLAGQDADPGQPAGLFAGSPLYILYLRALGARIGPGAVVLAAHVPVCTDLLTIGAGTVVRKDALVHRLPGRAGRIQTGPVTIGARRGRRRGRRCWTSTPRSATARSSGTPRRCSPGRRCRPGESWHGSPAEPPHGDSAWCRRRAAAGCAGSPTRCCSWSTCCSCPPARPRAVLVAARRSVPLVAAADRSPGTTAVATRTFYLRVARLVARAVRRRRSLARARRHRYRAAAAAPVLRPDRRLPALRHPLLAAPDRRAALTNSRVLQRPVRRQLVHRRTTCRRSATGFAAAWSRPARTSASRSGTTRRYLSTVGTGTMVSDGLSF